MASSLNTVNLFFLFYFIKVEEIQHLGKFYSVIFSTFFHVLGCGDHTLEEISLLPDPCPLPNAEKKRSLNEKERLMYAPLSGVGGVVYDKVATNTKTLYC